MLPWCAAVAAILLAAGRVSGAEELTAQLSLMPDGDSTHSLQVFFHGDPKQVRYGKAPGDVGVEIEPLAEPENAYRVRFVIPENGDFAGQPAMVVRPGSVLQFRVKHGGRLLPYRLRYERDRDGGETFLWSAAYRMEGTVRLGSCTEAIRLYDLNGDGNFDSHDAHLGPDLQVGQERHRSDEILDLCGAAWELASVAQDGTGVRWRTSGSAAARLNRPLPSFDAAATGNIPLEWATFRGKVILVHLWATWCPACVDEIPIFQKIQAKYPDKLQIVSINVDTDDRRRRVESFLTQHTMPGLLVLAGQGEAGAVWRSVGSLPGTHLSLPFSAVADRQGVLRYYTRENETALLVPHWIDALMAAETARGAQDLQ